MKHHRMSKKPDFGHFQNKITKNFLVKIIPKKKIVKNQKCPKTPKISSFSWLYIKLHFQKANCSF
jgi:hypothetical protein